MIITAIDPGTVTLGIATLYIDDNLQILNIQAQTFNANILAQQVDMHNINSYNHSRYYKIKYLYNAIYSYLEYNTPNIIAIESPFINRLRPSAYGALLEAVSMIRLAVENTDIFTPIVFYEPASIKKEICNYGVCDKHQLRNIILTKLDITSFVNIYLLDEHSIDAIAVGYTHLQHIKKQHNKGS